MTRAVNTALAGSGGVLQVVQAAKTDTFTSTNTAYADVTGMSVSITPISSDSKILILVSTNISSGTQDNGMFQLVRGSTAIFVGNAAGSRTQASAQTRLNDGNGSATVVISYLDSPATTSTTTYKVQLKMQSGTGVINRTNTDTDVVGIARTASSITVMEIAG